MPKLEPPVIAAIIAGFVAMIGPPITVLITSYINKLKFRSPLLSRKKAIVGKWAGTVRQVQYSGGPPTYSVTVEFRENGRVFDGKATTTIRFGTTIRTDEQDIYGGFVAGSILKIGYKSSDFNVMQFGTVIVELNGEGNKLEGRLIGYGPISQTILSGTIELVKM